MSLVMFLGYFNSSIGIYNFLVLLAVMSFLVFYAFGAASDLMLMKKEANPGPGRVFRFLKNGMISLIAFYYSVYTIYGAGAEYVMYGFLLILIGFPFFIYNQNNQL